MNKQLQNNWSIYFHDYMDSNWNRESYEKLHTFNDIVSFWTIYNIIKEKLIMGMFFFMKENMFPKWDNSDNVKVNFISIKILKTNTLAFIEPMLAYMLTEHLYPHDPSIIQGLSISPKKNFCICKIWVHGDIDTTMLNLPEGYYGELLHK